MVVDNRTPGRNRPLPDPDNKLREDVERLIENAMGVDQDITEILLVLAQKAEKIHGHTIGDVTGLTLALDGKLAVGHHDALGDLSDVNVAGATNGQVIIRQGTGWIPVSLQVNNIVNLEALLNGKATPADITSAVNALKAGVSSAFDTFAEVETALGQKLNTADFAANLGNTIRDGALKTDLLSVDKMAIWDTQTQSFKAAPVGSLNGILSGVPVGMVFFSPKGTVPAGYFALEGGSFDQAVYPALYAYLGTNVLPDYRDRVLRGAGTLAGLVGTFQEDALQNHYHALADINGTIAISRPVDIQTGGGAGLQASGGSLGYQVDRAGTIIPPNGGAVPRVSPSETRVKSAIGKFVIKAYSALTDAGTANLVAIEAAQQFMVRFDAQVLTQTQKAQALKNIGGGWEVIDDIVLATPQQNLTWTTLGPYNRLRMRSNTYTTVSSTFCLQLGEQGGAVWHNAANSYANQVVYGTQSAVVASGYSAGDVFSMSAAAVNQSVYGQYSLEVDQFNEVASARIRSDFVYQDSTPTFIIGSMGGYDGTVPIGANRRDSMRIFFRNGNLVAGSRFLLEGHR